MTSILQETTLQLVAVGLLLMLQLAANTGMMRPCQQRLLLHTRQSRHAKRLERAVLHLAQTHVRTPLWTTSPTSTVTFALKLLQEWNLPIIPSHTPRSTTLATRLAAPELVAASWTANHAALMAMLCLTFLQRIVTTVSQFGSK